MDTNTTIGNSLRELRKKEKITQVQLSEFLGITQGAVAQWEAGITQPNIKLLPKLASILGCTTDELLGIQKTPTRGGQGGAA